MANIVQLRALNYINLKDYGCVIDGVTDDSVGFSAAYAAAAAAGMGLYQPGGTLIKGNDTLRNNVTIDLGGGTIKLKNGANTDLFSAFTSSINLGGTVGSGSSTAAKFWTIKNGTLDGNKANQSSGTSYPLRAYAYGEVLEHLEILNGYSGNILLDYWGNPNPSSPANAFMSRWRDVMSHDCNGIGIQAGGPTDMQWDNVNVFATGGVPVHIAPNAVFTRMSNCHFWATPLGIHACTLLCEADGLKAINCQIEGSDTVAVAILANDAFIIADIGSTADASRAGRGYQLGQTAGNTPFPGQIFQSAGVTTSAAANICYLSGDMYSCNGGGVDEQNTQDNVYALFSYQTSGTAIVGGYPMARMNGFILPKGLTSDGSPGKGGIFQIQNGSFNGFRIFDKNYNTLFNVDTYDSVFAVNNGHSFSGYSDAGSTEVYRLNAGDGSITPGLASGLGGALRSGSGAPSAGLGSNGDFYFRTDTPGTTNQRIYVKSAGSWVGIV